MAPPPASPAADREASPAGRPSPDGRPLPHPGPDSIAAKIPHRRKNFMAKPQSKKSFHIIMAFAIGRAQNLCAFYAQSLVSENGAAKNDPKPLPS
jgi:hypothetical protein